MPITLYQLILYYDVLKEDRNLDVLYLWVTFLGTTFSNNISKVHSVKEELPTTVETGPEEQTLHFLPQ